MQQGSHSRRTRLMGVGLAFWSALGCAGALAGEVTEQALLGTWECGPTTMHGPGFKVEVTTRITKRADHTYSDTNTSVLIPDTGVVMTNRDTSHGTWRLDGDIVTSEVLEVRFLSSSNLDLSREEGQRILDELVSKKSVYRSRILALDANTSRSIPVGSMYKEAEVESTCRRLAD